MTMAIEPVLICSSPVAPSTSGGKRDRHRRDVEDLDEALEELALAPDSDPSALDRFGWAEFAGEQWMESHIGLEDEVCVWERALVDLECTVVDSRVDDELAEAKLVVGP
jgi:hypothetical protein